MFDAGNNQLTGPLPLSLACLGKVEQLNFAGNLLYGAVPEMLCGLGNLANFSLSGNYFTRVGSLCQVLIQRGVLDVRNNCIPGLPFQRPVKECTKFFTRSRLCPRIWSYTYLPCNPFHFASSLPQMALVP